MDLRNGNFTVEFTEADKYSEPACDKLVRAGCNVHRLSTPEADCLWVRLSTRVNAQLLNLYPRVKCVVTATTGTDHVDVLECERRGVKVLSLQGETEFLRGVRATAEHTLSLMLWCLRGWVPDGKFQRPADAGGELCGKRVGIIGMGRIGTQVARLVEAFGATVQDVPNDADILSIHLPLNEQTRGLCGWNYFGYAKRGCYVVNTSRGGVIHEPALLECLVDGLVSRAALDVLDGEPNVSLNRLMCYSRTYPNRLLITPHIGGYTRESLEKCELFMAEKLLKWIQANG